MKTITLKVLEADDGKIIGACGFYMTYDQFVIEVNAQEHFLCILPEYRKMNTLLFILLRDVIAWAREIGVKRFLMSSYSKSDVERHRFNTMLMRIGFEEYSTLYSMTLNENQGIATKMEQEGWYNVAKQQSETSAGIDTEGRTDEEINNGGVRT